jgi:hypothetical protein
MTVDIMTVVMLESTSWESTKTRSTVFPESQELQSKPSAAAATTASSDKTIKLNRRVDLFSGIALIVGTMIGTSTYTGVDNFRRKFFS